MRICDLLERFDINDRDFDDNNATVGGWAIQLLGGYPAKGDLLNFENLTATSKATQNLRALRLRINVNEKQSV